MPTSHTQPAPVEAASAAPSATVESRRPEELLQELRLYQVELTMQNEALRQSQLELEESRDRYVDLYEFAPVGYFSLSRAAVIQAINLTGAHMLGLPREGLVGQRFAPWVAGADQDRWQQHFVRAFAAEDKQRFELELQRRDGRVFSACLECQCRRPRGSAPLLLIAMMDISERIRAERELRASLTHLRESNAKLEATQAQLLQSEKMAAVGQLAAGVAHEINNPIGYVNSNLSSLRDEVTGLLRVLAAYATADELIAQHPSLAHPIAAAKASADLEYLQTDIGPLIEESLEGLQRVRTIVRDLSEFSRTGPATWAAANLETSLDSTLNIASNLLKYKAQVHKAYAGVPEVECIAAQINQVFMNLLVNASQAIEGTGVITLRTGYDSVEVWAEVEDSGAGIAPEHLRRIFEPFFTTKGVGQGTGLGLSLAYAIAQRHGGRIEVDSVVGRGTRMRLLLPRQRPATPALALEGPGPAA